MNQAERLLAQANEYRARGNESGDPLHHAVADLAIMRLMNMAKLTTAELRERLFDEEQPIGYRLAGTQLEDPFEFCERFTESAVNCVALVTERFAAYAAGDASS